MYSLPTHINFQLNWFQPSTKMTDAKYFTTTKKGQNYFQTLIKIECICCIISGLNNILGEIFELKSELNSEKKEKKKEAVKKVIASMTVGKDVR